MSQHPTNLLLAFNQAGAPYLVDLCAKLSQEPEHGVVLHYWNLDHSSGYQDFKGIDAALVLVHQGLNIQRLEPLKTVDPVIQLKVENGIETSPNWPVATDTLGTVGIGQSVRVLSGVFQYLFEELDQPGIGWTNLLTEQRTVWALSEMSPLEIFTTLPRQIGDAIPAPEFPALFAEIIQPFAQTREALPEEGDPSAQLEGKGPVIDHKSEGLSVELESAKGPPVDQKTFGKGLKRRKKKP